MRTGGQDRSRPLRKGLGEGAQRVSRPSRALREKTLSRFEQPPWIGVVAAVQSWFFAATIAKISWWQVLTAEPATLFFARFGNEGTQVFGQTFVLFFLCPTRFVLGVVHRARISH